MSVYVVDDHEAVLASLVELIDSAPTACVVGSSTSAATAVEQIPRRRPDVAVIDAHLGADDGLEVCRELAVIAPEVACVVVTADVDHQWGPSEAAEAGVEAVVLKQILDFRLLDVIAEVAGGAGGPTDGRSSR